MKYLMAGFLLACVALGSCTKNYDYDFSTQDGVNRYPIDWQASADSSTSFLINNYWNSNPGYFNKSNVDAAFNYWPQAHGLDVLLDAYSRTQDNKYKSYFDKWYTGVQQKNGNTFLNYFYDDMGWNALAILRAYDATSDDKFKTAANVIWTDIKTGWNANEGGGIAWNKGKLAYKNTPANGPACILAARLYERFKNPDDLDWAKKIYNWVKDSLYDANTGFVNDGINSNGDGQRDTWAFTYNQGLMIGAAVELYNITKDPAYLNDAENIADNTLSSSSLTTSDRLLHDEGEGDGGLFKGVFVRYFTQLILCPDLEESVKKRYIAFLKLNAETLWYQGTNKQLGLFGSYWKKMPGNSSDLTTEESGCMLMEAAALLSKKNLL
ncbi:glycosyl hydrolase family 76 [Arachidicoccus soli]|uniref:Glycosyl hydrolase family 76 n=1 Tax=Arachidicoccus soli TaxID=2341117 RepID=A0A386HV26_9BACT|nr:glycosyl hydrolase family 76 [Arachidicoccus soli]